MEQQTYPTYPVGTKLKDIAGFDRGQKVVFECPVHHTRGHFASKQPGSSSWFGNGTPCDCYYGDFVTVYAYTPTRIG